MECKVVPLRHEHLATWNIPLDIERAYMSPGSVAYCLLADGEPVFAGGVVNLQWSRGEAWMLPTPWFRNNVRTCFRFIKKMVPEMARAGGFKRLQATCSIIKADALAEIKAVRTVSHLGFLYEGTMKQYGPNGETCHMYARIF